MVTFQQLHSGDFARLVREADCKVCVFSIGGTRYSFILEYTDQAQQNFPDAYLKIIGQRDSHLFCHFFPHGSETPLTSDFCPDMLELDSDDEAIIERGLFWFAQNPEFPIFYGACDILYSHLYFHQVNETYSDFTPEDWQTLILFYRQKPYRMLGISKQLACGGVWYPPPPIELPPQ